ncbi:MAG: hypothetical protein IJJ94_05800 [Bacteroidaceae bacterium]|nr:hypothetical protein [Bacteroidaceae bacterium]
MKGQNAPCAHGLNPQAMTDYSPANADISSIVRKFPLAVHSSLPTSIADITTTAHKKTLSLLNLLFTSQRDVITSQRDAITSQRDAIKSQRVLKNMAGRKRELERRREKM